MKLCTSCGICVLCVAFTSILNVTPTTTMGYFFNENIVSVYPSNVIVTAIGHEKPIISI